MSLWRERSCEKAEVRFIKPDCYNYVRVLCLQTKISDKKWRPCQDRRRMAKTIDQLTKAVNAKLQTLKLTQGQAITAIEDKAVLSMERIQNALKKKVEEVHDLKTEI